MFCTLTHSPLTQSLLHPTRNVQHFHELLAGIMSAAVAHHRAAQFDSASRGGAGSASSSHAAGTAAREAPVVLVDRHNPQHRYQKGKFLGKVRAYLPGLHWLPAKERCCVKYSCKSLTHTPKNNCVKLQGGFAKCYLLTEVDSNRQWAGKIVEKKTLIKYRAKEKVRVCLPLVCFHNLCL